MFPPRPDLCFPRSGSIIMCCMVSLGLLTASWLHFPCHLGEGGVKWAFPPREPCVMQQNPYPSVPWQPKTTTSIQQQQSREVDRATCLYWASFSSPSIVSVGLLSGSNSKILAVIVHSNMSHDEIFLISSWWLFKKSWSTRGHTDYVVCFFFNKSIIKKCSRWPGLSSTSSGRLLLLAQPRSNHMTQQDIPGQRLLQRDPSLSNLKLHVERNPPMCCRKCQRSSRWQSKTYVARYFRSRTPVIFP